MIAKKDMLDSNRIHSDLGIGSGQCMRPSHLKRTISRLGALMNRSGSEEIRVKGADRSMEST